MYIARYLIQDKKSFMTLGLLANTLKPLPTYEKKNMKQDQHDPWGISYFHDFLSLLLYYL